MPAPDRGRDDVLRLFLQHRVMLSGFLYTLVEDWELVEEALQETAVFVCNRWGDFAPGADFAARVRTAARMRVREAIHRRRAAPPPVEGILEGLDAAAVERTWAKRGAFPARHAEALAQCLRELPDLQRRTVEMHYVERRPCERIAARTKRRIDAVYASLSRIRQRLQQGIEQRLAQDGSK
jgi:RNA polymerase sigma factor (sigma-70 family)